MGAVVIVHEVSLPGRTSTADVAKDFVEQVESSSASSELLRPERLISLHIFWMSYMHSKPSEDVLGLDSNAYLFALAESRDLESERSILTELVFPALSMECKSHSINLNSILFGDGTQRVTHCNVDRNPISKLVEKVRLLRNFKAHRQRCLNAVMVGVIGCAQLLENGADKQVLQDDDETDWVWATAGGCAGYSSNMLHLYSSLSLQEDKCTTPQSDNPGAGARVSNNGVLAMIRRQEFGETDGEFIKHVPVMVRAVFQSDLDNKENFNHLISRVRKVLGEDNSAEYTVNFSHFNQKPLPTHTPDTLRVVQSGVEAFALDVYENLARRFLSARVPAVWSSHAYPWQSREVELQQQGLHRHEEIFFAEKDGQLESILKELISVATSMDLTSPVLVLLDGVSGSGRSALLAKIASTLTSGRERRFVVYLCKPQGCCFDDAVATVTSQLWLQLVGGKHMHMQGHKMKWNLSDLFDVVQRASAKSCNDSSSSYRRVVLIFDGFDDEEQLQISDHLLARPRLFPLVTCLLATHSSHGDVTHVQSEGEGVRLQNRKRLVKSHLHTRVVAMPRLSHTESLQVATNLLSNTHDNAETVVGNCRQHLLHKKEIWRPGYIRCLVQCMRSSSGVQRAEAVMNLAPTRSQALHQLLGLLNDVYGTTTIGALLCSLLSAPGNLDSELRVRHCRPNGHLSDLQYLSIVDALQPYTVLEDFWRDTTLILAEDCWPDVISKYVIPPLDCLERSMLDSLARKSIALLRQRRAAVRVAPEGPDVQRLPTEAESRGGGRHGLYTELPENLGDRLSSFWATMEEEVILRCTSSEVEIFQIILRVIPFNILISNCR